MNKKAQLQIIFNPKTVSFNLGGAIIGYFIFQNTNAAIIGGLIGLASSFIR